MSGDFGFGRALVHVWELPHQDAREARVQQPAKLGSHGPQGAWLLLEQPRPLLDLLLDGRSAPCLTLWGSVALGALAVALTVYLPRYYASHFGIALGVVGGAFGIVVGFLFGASLGGKEPPSAPSAD